MYLLKQLLPFSNWDVAEQVQVAWVSAEAVQLIDEKYLGRKSTSEYTRFEGGHLSNGDFCYGCNNCRLYFLCPTHAQHRDPWLPRPGLNCLHFFDYQHHLTMFFRQPTNRNRPPNLLPLPTPDEATETAGCRESSASSFLLRLQEGRE